ncbi:hypothetical protein GDO78_015146 [Eleutherodactylus coqui]|uniref:Uncharacterized protein n=1 Tax=Eleutherodactylus coqui TaxID=57060 RepID=A0A8J6E8M8_ELECQ|nr:hypothetical protein GDO78_015146 [Eleutherodactylus coqui]
MMKGWFPIENPAMRTILQVRILPWIHHFIKANPGQKLPIGEMIPFPEDHTLQDGMLIILFPINLKGLHIIILIRTRMTTKEVGVNHQRNTLVINGGIIIPKLM